MTDQTQAPVSPTTPDPLQQRELPHMMVDLETLGTDPYSPILSIGATIFSMEPGPGLMFYIPVKLQSCFDVGLRPSASTIQWWMQQSDQARAVFNDPQAVDLPMALDMFSLFVNSRPLTIWGNSARFDMGLLEAAYKACHKTPPWEFWREGCYRTIKNLPGAKAIKLVREGTYHHALDDAVSQANHLRAINEALQLHL